MISPTPTLPATTKQLQEAQECLYAAPPIERRGFFDSMKTRMNGLQQTADLIEQLIHYWGNLLDDATKDTAADALAQFEELKLSMGFFATIPGWQTSSCDDISTSLYTVVHVVKIKVSNQLGVQEGQRSADEAAVNKSTAKLTSVYTAAKAQATFGRYLFENATECEYLAATIKRSQTITIYIDFGGAARGKKACGSFGSIHQAWTDESKTQLVCAVKVPVTTRPSENELELEGNIWEYLQTPKRHPNILEYLGKCSIGPDFIGLLSPWMDNAKNWKESLKDYSEDTNIQFIENIASALRHMHEKEVLHGDVKLSNVIISSNPLTPLLCDFGFSLRWNVDDTRSSVKNNSTAAYMSPEAHEGVKKSLASDVWSFGILMLHVLLKEFPLLSHVKDLRYPEQELHSLIVEMDLRPAMPGSLTRGGVQSWKLALQCLSPSADVRPCMRDIHIMMEAIIEGREAEVSARLAQGDEELRLAQQLNIDP